VGTGTPSAQFPFAFGNHIAVAGNILYSHARYYDSGAGRFLSEDPRGVRTGDANFYRYALDNPTTFNDPTGLIAGGINYGTSGGVGVGIGAAGQVEGGAGVFLNQDKGYSPNAGAYAEGGAMLGGGGPDSTVGLPSQSATTDWVVGAAVPIPGVGGFISNARQPCDLNGDFSSYNFTFGIFSFSFQTGTANDGKFIWTLSAAGGEGLGFAASHYTTNTFKTVSVR